MPKIVNFIKNKFKLLFIVTSIISSTLIFCAGIFSKSTVNEETSFYTANVTKNETKSGTILGLSVSKGKSGKSLPECFKEFHNLYGAFKEKTMTFAPIINSNKKLNISLCENNKKLTDKLSFLYYGPVGSIEYEGFYKHYTLPIQLMFEDTKKGYDFSRYIINISESQANKLLEEKGIAPTSNGSYSLEQYKTLLYTKCNLMNNDEKEEFCINNIYLEKNYYYEGLKETIGEFIMVSYYLPWNLREKQENCYFLNDDSFQNKYILEYVSNVYRNGDYNISLIRNNLIHDVDENRILSFNQATKLKTNLVSVLFVFLAIIFAGFGIIILCFNSLINLKNIILLNLCYLIPYLIFSIIFNLSNCLFIFSSFSCKWFLIISCSSFYISFISWFVKENRSFMKGLYYCEEISI